MKKLFSILLIAASLTLSHSVFAASITTTCTVLTKNLSYGQLDSTTAGQVTPLQNFLYATGYLSATPTGRYGSLTLAAVKKFQTAHGISSIGSVGPQTRAAIEKASCGTTGNVAAPVISGLNSSTGITSLGGEVNTPVAGTQLTIGQTFTIQWTGGTDQNAINILLEDQNGNDVGYIAGNISASANSYVWTVGNVSIAGQQTSVISPGNYRVHIIDNATYGSKFNITSDQFTIGESPLSIHTILPTSAPADGKTSIFLYGTGFNNLTMVNMTGPYNLNLTPQYVSPDGKLIWFYIPNYIPTPDQYQISTYNDYSSADIAASGTPSNIVDLQVVPQ